MRFNTKFLLYLFVTVLLFGVTTAKYPGIGESCVTSKGYRVGRCMRSCGKGWMKISHAYCNDGICCGDMSQAKG